jgi:hypothetical protein
MVQTVGSIVSVALKPERKHVRKIFAGPGSNG